jgi:hypothetical protein
MCLTVLNRNGKRIQATKAELAEKNTNWYSAVSKMVGDRMLKSHVMIAPCDMIVYKGLDRVQTNFWWEDNPRYAKNRFKAPHRQFEYEPGYTYYQTDQEDKFTFDLHYKGGAHCVVIDRGLHCTSSIARANVHGLVVAEFIIPKGAQYFVGERDEMVTDQYTFKRVLSAEEIEQGE